jgi:hypothetical protein
MAENLADLIQGRPGTEHPGRQGVPQDVRPLEGRTVQSCALDGAADNRAEGSGMGEPSVRRLG